MHPEYQRLEFATDSGKIRNRIEKEFHRFRGDSGNLKEFRVTRVFPRRNGRFAIQYEMVFGDSQDIPDRKLFFCGNLLGPGEKWPRYADPDNKDVIIFKDIRLVIPIFPFDPKLKYLPVMVSTVEIPGTEECIGNHLDTDRKGLRVSGYEILGYRLERRCVIRYSVEKSIGTSGRPEQFHFVAKVFRPGRAQDPAGKLAWLQHHGFSRDAADGMTVPQIIHCDDNRGIIIMEDAPGISLHHLLGDSSFEKACGLAAGFLNKLHSLKAPDAQPYSIIDEMETIQKKIKLCGDIFPTIRERLQTIFERLSKESSDENISACVHGDFHDKQVLYSAKRSTLLDCDNMKLADPASDYGNFLAHLILRRIQFPELAGNIEAGMRTFARTYAEDNNDFKLRARWWVAATLVRLAVLYSLRPKWRACVPDILRETGRTLERKNFKYGGINAIYSS